MTTIFAKYVGGLRTEAVHLGSGSIIQTDAPKDNQGKGEDFSPTDLLAASLGCCMMTIAGIAARTHHFDIDGTTIEITKKMSQTPPRKVNEIELSFFFPDRDYSDKEKRIIETAIRTCPVSLSLHPELKQSIILKYKS